VIVGGDLVGCREREKVTTKTKLEQDWKQRKYLLVLDSYIRRPTAKIGNINYNESTND
jgi:transposase-like protein